jgi:hypothetical protein
MKLQSCFFPWYFIYFHLLGTSSLKRSFVFILWQIEECWFNAHTFHKHLAFCNGNGLDWWLLFFDYKRLTLMVFIHVPNIDRSLKTSWTCTSHQGGHFLIYFFHD